MDWCQQPERERLSSMGRKRGILVCDNVQMNCVREWERENRIKQGRVRHMWRTQKVPQRLFHSDTPPSLMSESNMVWPQEGVYVGVRLVWVCECEQHWRCEWMSIRVRVSVCMLPWQRIQERLLSRCRSLTPAINVLSLSLFHSHLQTSHTSIDFSRTLKHLAHRIPVVI